MRGVIKRAIILGVCALMLPAAAKSKAKKETKTEKPKEIENKPAAQRVLRLEGGKVSLVIMQQKGVWRLYAVDGKDDKIALLSEYDEGAGSSFFLKAGRSEYRLNAFGGADVAVTSSSDSAIVDYSVGQVARVRVQFQLLRSAKGADYDIVKVKATVTNLKKKADKFALKGVFDTVLEEKTGGTFSTAAIGKMSHEVQLTDMAKDRWVLSSDGKTGVQFLFAGADTTPAEAVTLANSEIVALPLWTPVISAIRSFDNVMMYNNSAICVNWPSMRLSSGESRDRVFYIAVGIDGGLPRGEEFIASLDAPQVPTDGGIDASYAKDTDGEGAAQEVQKVDMDYVWALIERIKALEDDGSNTNVEELLQLNTELDNALDILKDK